MQGPGLTFSNYTTLTKDKVQSNNILISETKKCFKDEMYKSNSSKLL